MKGRGILNTSLLLKGIFASSIFILIFISVVSYKHTTSLTESSNALQHSYNVRNELEQVISFIKDAETGQRGYLLSHDSSMLTPYMDARDKVNKSMYSLSMLAKGNPAQEGNIDTLYNLITERFAYMNLLLNASVRVSMNEELLHRNLLKEQEVMNKIRLHVDRMISLEQQSLQDRRERFTNEMSFTPLFTFLLLIFSVLVFIFAYLRLNSQVGVLRSSNEALLLSAELINHAENIGAFSTWRWNSQKNEIEYSDNYAALLGLGQHKQITFKQIIERVHPEDQAAVISHNMTPGVRQSSPLLYRIYRNDGDLRYFSSVGKTVHTLNGSSIYLGITSDITEQYKKNMSLQERNLELEQTNMELASFNYVASHDLQEPLRIIQTYISRIREKEHKHLSDSTKEYFERIRSSANRMQILINDLLMFSRTNKSEKIFETADLNELLAQARQELSALIEEKGAIIDADELPELNVIPYQIKQLFLNLIGNSLKYAREGVAPKIEIRKRALLDDECPQFRRNPRVKYVCFSVIDNGLGFEQQFAENIFILFKRLHLKNEYPGTGIGLSICKKIAEIHSGFIYAEGVPNEGSRFHIILPEASA